MKTRDKCALLVIDMQREYFKKDGFLVVPDGRAVADNLLVLMEAARRLSVPVIHVRHIGKNPLDVTFQAGSDAVQFVDGFMPQTGEPVVTKTRPGSFYLTDLDDILHRRAIDTVIIGGLMSFMCCDTTAREAHARGYSVYFLRDATAAINLGDIPASSIHAAICAIQGLVFSRVVTTDQMVRILEENGAT